MCLVKVHFDESEQVGDLGECFLCGKPVRVSPLRFSLADPMSPDAVCHHECLQSKSPQQVVHRYHLWVADGAGLTRRKSGSFYDHMVPARGSC